MLQRLSRWFHSTPRLVRLGLPFISFVVGGSFALKEFTQLRYTYRKAQTLDPKELEKSGLQRREQSEITPEAIFERDIKNLDLDNWENVRGPRPDEEGFDEKIEALKKKAAADRQRIAQNAINRIRNE